MATQTIVNIVCADCSFNFLKIVSAFRMLIQEQLFRNAIVIYLLRLLSS